MEGSFLSLHLISLLLRRAGLSLVMTQVRLALPPRPSSSALSHPFGVGGTTCCASGLLKGEEGGRTKGKERANSICIEIILKWKVHSGLLPSSSAPAGHRIVHLPRDTGYFLTSPPLGLFLS